MRVITGDFTYRHAGQRFQPGSEVEVSEAEARSLLKAGLATLAGGEAPAPPARVVILPQLLAGAELLAGDPAALLQPADVCFVMCPVPGCFEDAEVFRSMCAEEGASGHILAVNRCMGGEFTGRIDLAATLEAGEVFAWKKEREAAGGNIDRKSVV